MEAAEAAEGVAGEAAGVEVAHSCAKQRRGPEVLKATSRRQGRRPSCCFRQAAARVAGAAGPPAAWS